MERFKKLLQAQMMPWNYELAIFTVITKHGEKAVKEMTDWLEGKPQTERAIILQEAILIAEKYGLKAKKIYH